MCYTEATLFSTLFPKLAFILKPNLSSGVKHVVGTMTVNKFPGR